MLLVFFLVTSFSRDQRTSEASGGHPRKKGLLQLFLHHCSEHGTAVLTSPLLHQRVKGEYCISEMLVLLPASSSHGCLLRLIKCFF